jgi:hypothetical protein
VAKHVGAKLQLETVGGFEALRRRHDARVVDENMKRALRGEFLLRELMHGREAGEIDKRQFGVRSGYVGVQTG